MTSRRRTWQLKMPRHPAETANAVDRFGWQVYVILATHFAFFECCRRSERPQGLKLAGPAAASIGRCGKTGVCSHRGTPQKARRRED